MYSSRLQELTNYSEIKLLLQANIVIDYDDFIANHLTQAHLSYHRARLIF